MHSILQTGTIDGFDTDRDRFVGMDNGFHEPRAVVNNRCENSVADGMSPMASHMFRIELAPQESTDIVFLLGYGENANDNKWESAKVINKSNAIELSARIDSSEKVDRELQNLRVHWDSVLSSYCLSHDDPNLSRMVNIWNQYQCIVTYNLARSASLFESGIGRGLGFRDTNQDLLGVVHQIPDKTRQRIIDAASTQMEDGSCYHQYQPLTKMGNHAIGDNFNDDPLWLLASVSSYIKETGDWDILDVNVPFDNDENNSRDPI